MWRFYTPTASPNPAPLVTALPSGAVDGQQVVLVDSVSAPTYTWLLQYVSAKSSNKWVFVGGAPAYAEVLTFETTASTAYANLATTGPSITVPVTGSYWVETEAVINNSSLTAQDNDMSFAIGAATATNNEQLLETAAASSRFAHGLRKQRKSLTAADALVAKYKTSAGTAGFAYRVMRLTPIAIGG